MKLTHAMHRRTAGYSKGMRQRIRIAQAIAHSPRFLIVDEPLSGLDPLARRDMSALFGELGRDGTSILISSHVLHEVEGLTERVVLLHHGRLLAQGAIPEIRKLLSRHPRKLEIRARDPRKLASGLIGREEVVSMRIGSDRSSLVLKTSDLELLLGALPAIAGDARAGIQGLQSTDAGLEAVFEYLVS